LGEASPKLSLADIAGNVTNEHGASVNLILGEEGFIRVGALSSEVLLQVESLNAEFVVVTECLRERERPDNMRVMKETATYGVEVTSGVEHGELYDHGDRETQHALKLRMKKVDLVHGAEGLEDFSSLVHGDDTASALVDDEGTC